MSSPILRDNRFVEQKNPLARHFLDHERLDIVTQTFNLPYDVCLPGGKLLIE